ncbi:MAG: hypothetical protein LUQ71_07800 [Methanoregula sp.]|nr:hypothetical protein [Methanoregula sp.]
MKKFIGLLILIIVLVVVSGCTQQATTTPVTTTAPTEIPTIVATTVETTIAATVEATPETTPAETTIVANVTAPVVENTTVIPAVTEAVTVKMTPSTKVTVIHIANNTFTPSTLMVLPGTGITWVNDDTSIHSVKVIGDHAGKFNSGDIASTARWGYTFGESEGTFEYADGYNPNVTGVIIVKKGDSLVGYVITSTPYVTSNATW